MSHIENALKKAEQASSKKSGPIGTALNLLMILVSVCPPARKLVLEARGEYDRLRRVGEFTCPECGSDRFGTNTSTLVPPHEQVRSCNGWVCCSFTWPASDDYKYFNMPDCLCEEIDPSDRPCIDCAGRGLGG